ncbi:tRNA-dihydrouridine(16) synthase [compost metagenome]
MPWQQIPPLLLAFWQQVSVRVERRHRAGRLKQWLNYLRQRYPQAQDAFDELRLVHEPAAIETWLRASQIRPPITTEPIPALPAELAHSC